MTSVQDTLMALDMKVLRECRALRFGIEKRVRRDKEGCCEGRAKNLPFRSRS